MSTSFGFLMLATKYPTSGTQLIHRSLAGGENPHFNHFEFALCCHHKDGGFLRDGAADHADVNHHAAVCVVMGIEDEGAQCRITLVDVRCRKGIDDFVEDCTDSLSRFCRDEERMGRSEEHTSELQ